MNITIKDIVAWIIENQDDVESLKKINRLTYTFIADEINK